MALIQNWGNVIENSRNRLFGAIIGTSVMPYFQKVTGVTAVNYRSEPTDYRTEKGCAYSEVFACVKAGDQPVTPSIAAHVGDPVVIHVLGAFSEQVQLFSVSGHE